MAHTGVVVGSVGTPAFIILLPGHGDQNPLIVRVKGATQPVLVGHLPRSRFHNPDERVVRRQRMRPAAGDICPGRTKGGQDNRCLSWRQRPDMKGSPLVDSMGASRLACDAGMCGRALARAGDSGRIVATEGCDP